MLPVTRAGRITAGLLLGITVLLSIGCNNATPKVESAAITPRRAAPLDQIRATPEYQQAKAAFSKGNVAQAKKLLFSLSAKPGLSAVEKQFLQKQIALCDTGKKLPDAPIAKIAPLPPTLVDCGPRALAIAAQRLGKPANVAALRKLAGTQGDGTSLAGLEKAAKSIGLTAEAIQVDRDALSQLPTPAVAWLDGNHFVALLQVDRDSATLHDPNDSKEKEMPLLELLARSGGIVLSLKKS
jgi:hypothetical protein